MASVLLKSIALGLAVGNSFGNALTDNTDDRSISYDTRDLPNILSSSDPLRDNAFVIFNTIHSAMRQWGSSLNHNGMSFFVATLPEGEVLYHGGPDADRPPGIDGKGFDWAAFESEHAQHFAASWEGGHHRVVANYDKSRKKHSKRGKKSREEAVEDLPIDSASWRMEHDVWRWSGESEEVALVGNEVEAGQKQLASLEDDDKKKKKPPQFRDFPPQRGYFHIYKAERPLNLLYIDGMGAGKADFGSLDSQDYVLLDRSTDNDNIDGPFMGESERAGGLCNLAKDWAWKGGQIDGFIRMEAGFEVIYCNFSEGAGLGVVSINASPFSNETSGVRLASHYEYMRGITERYHGLPSSRLSVDWSSMVSAFFYDLNLTNPDPQRQELPRVLNTTRAQRRVLRERVRQVVSTRHGLSLEKGLAAVIDWQGIVDMIVTRFSARIASFSEEVPDEKKKDYLSRAGEMASTVLNLYVDYPDEAPAEHWIEQCAALYLTPATSRAASWTPEDASIFVAVDKVAWTICTTMFDVRDKLAGMDEDDEDKEDENVEAVRKMFVDLKNTLQWTTWRECGACPDPDEVCFVAMFPWGDDEDHYHPSCTAMDQVGMRNGYWWKQRSLDAADDS